jgi:HAD superfamily hydrolase (TIGR01509 family)
VKLTPNPKLETRNGLQAIIFDMDGLLIDSEPIWREAEKIIFSEVNITLTDEMCFTTVGLRIDEVVEHWYMKFPWEKPSKEMVKNKIIDKVIELILAKGEILPGVMETIQYFHSKGFPLAIASASSQIIIDAVTEKLNIKKYFNVIHSAEFEEYGKPHPAVFISTAKKLNVHPTNCLVFEDSVNGVIAAKASRMKVIAVPENIHFENSKFEIADMRLKSLNDFNEEVFLGIG